MHFPSGRSYDALLFDMDGTLLSSIAAAERIWSAWARRHGLDVETFLPTIHGLQSVETVRRAGLPGIDPVAEAAEITRQEIEDVEGIDALAGARTFLAGLPAGRWAVVTSASLALAQARLAAARLAPPPVLITADDVERSKPAPDGYLLAARRLGAAAADCLVFEDAPAGIAAAEAAGADVVVMTATHGRPLATPHPTLPDYRSLRLHQDDRGRLALSRD